MNLACIEGFFQPAARLVNMSAIPEFTVTGNGLKQLAGFPQLESLSLGGPWIDNAGMDYVTACHNLKKLFLQYTKIGDKGFGHIGRLGKLERLTLDSHFVTDQGMAHLTSLRNLNHIELRASRVTDETLKHISKIASITRFDLSGSGYPGVRIGRNFTGAGYTHLASMPNLKTLWLNNADVSWTELRGLKQLDSMHLMMPTMSADDVRRLQRALPDTRVGATWGYGSVVPIQFGEQPAHPANEETRKSAQSEAKAATPTEPPLALSKTNGKAAKPDGKRVDMGVVVAEHVLLLDGKKIITWDELEKRIAALPDPSLAYPHFYSTRGAHEAGIYPKAKEKIWHLHKKFKLKGHSEGSLGARADFRYDRIETAKDLVPDERLRIEGRVVDGKGEPIADAEVLLVNFVDISIPFNSYEVALVEGRVRNQLGHVMTRSDAKGQFVLYPPKDMKSYVVALHPTAGFTLQRGKQLSNGGKIRLIPWASLESRFDGGAAQQQGATLSTLVREKDGFPEVGFSQYWSDLKKDPPAGVFRFTHVPPIFATTISRSFPDKQGGSFTSPGATVSLLPGESRRLDLAPMSNKQQEWLEQIREMSRSRGKTK